MSDTSNHSDGTTYSEKHDPHVAVQGWISQIEVSRQIGTSLFAVLGQLLDTDEVVALLCPQCIKGTLLMHPVWTKAPHEELVRFAKNEIELTRVVGMFCDDCKRHLEEAADANSSQSYLTKQQVLDSMALQPLRTQGKEVQIMTIDDDDECVGNVSEHFFSILKIGLHMISISDLMVGEGSAEISEV